MSDWAVDLETAKLCHEVVHDIDVAAKTLMARVAEGDQKAFVELIDQHGKTLAKLVGRLTGWHTDQDDILQEVFLVVWKRAGTFDGRGSLEAWLKRIAINRCRNRFRTINSIRRKLERYVGLGILQSQEKLRSSVVEDSVGEVGQAMQKMSESDRTLLALYYLEEMSGEEVARTLRVKPETLHVRLFRARTRLKKILECS